MDQSFIFHCLNVNPSTILKKQPPRRSSREHSNAIKGKVLKLKRARAIKEVFYPKWLANTVVVKKKTEKWRVCVDFTNLNKAYLKDPFPLPRIDHLVDTTVGHPRMSFFGRLLGLLVDTISSRQSGKDYFSYTHWELLLQSNALWIEKCKIYLPKDDGQDV